VTGNPHAAFHRRANVTASTVSLSDKPCNACGHDHAGHHISRHTRPAPTSREQIRNHLIGKQLTPMGGQQRKDTARLQKMTRYRLRIQQLRLTIRSTMHPEIIPNNTD
jgi:hypothetical protein